MAENTWVNSQITDSVTQANVKVLGDAPAQSMGFLYQMASQATGLGMQNLVANQQHNNTVDTAVVTGAVDLIYTLDVAADAKATTEIMSGNTVAETMEALKAVIEAFTQKPAGPSFD